MGKRGNRRRRQQRKHRKVGDIVSEMRERDYAEALERACRQEELEFAFRSGEVDPNVPWETLEEEEYKAGPMSESEAREGGFDAFVVNVIRDHKLDYPELYLDVFVEGPQWEERRFAEMFARSGCSRAAVVDDADLVVFTGGPDVDPVLYGMNLRHSQTRVDVNRDSSDLALYNYCFQRGIPMFGVCRGMQFLHVMNGGKLYQDVNNHYGPHKILDVNTKQVIEKVSSVHHQACIENFAGGMEIIATAAESTERHHDALKMERGKIADIEALFYRDTCCLGVQGHPEYTGYNYYTYWCLKQIEHNIIENPDIDWVQGHRRIRPELLEQRMNGFIIEGTKESK